MIASEKINGLAQDQSYLKYLNQTINDYENSNSCIVKQDQVEVEISIKKIAKAAQIADPATSAINGSNQK